jgi:hypothetical protein
LVGAKVVLVVGATGVEVGHEALPYGAEVLVVGATGVEVFRIGQEALVGAKVLFVGVTGVEVGQEALPCGAEVLVVGATGVEVPGRAFGHAPSPA